jgi:hypothetical protein
MPNVIAHTSYHKYVSYDNIHGINNSTYNLICRSAIIYEHTRILYEHTRIIYEHQRVGIGTVEVVFIDKQQDKSSGTVTTQPTPPSGY